MEGLAAAPDELAQGAVTFLEKRAGGLPIYARIGDGDSVTQRAAVLGEILAAGATIDCYEPAGHA